MSDFNDVEAARLAKEAFGLTTEETNVAVDAVNRIFHDMNKQIEQMPMAQVRDLSDHAINDMLIGMFSAVTKACTGKPLPFAMFILGARVGAMLYGRIQRPPVRVTERTIVFVGDKPMSPDQMKELKEKFGFPNFGINRKPEPDIPRTPENAKPPHDLEDDGGLTP